MNEFYQQIGKGMSIYSARFVGRTIPAFYKVAAGAAGFSLDYRVKPDNDGRLLSSGEAGAIREPPLIPPPYQGGD